MMFDGILGGFEQIDDTSDSIDGTPAEEGLTETNEAVPKPIAPNESKDNK